MIKLLGSFHIRPRSYFKGYIILCATIKTIVSIKCHTSLPPSTYGTLPPALSPNHP